MEYKPLPIEEFIYNFRNVSFEYNHAPKVIESVITCFTEGNCYFFALILSSIYNGRIVYDHRNGHFVFFETESASFYDITGKIYYEMKHIYWWDELKENDSALYDRIMRDCVVW